MSKKDYCVMTNCTNTAKKDNMLSLSSFSFCKTEKSNILFATQSEN